MGLYDKYARLAGERLQFSDYEHHLAPVLMKCIPLPKAGSAIKK